MTKNELLEQRPLLETYLREKTYSLSSFSFISIFTWQDFFQFEFRIIHEHLCVFAQNEAGAFLYLPPLGRRMDDHVIEECFEYLREGNQKSRVARIENVPEYLTGAFPAEKFSSYQKAYEYCYYKDEMVELKGNAYKSKRGDYNQFIKNHSYRYLPFEKKMIDECLALYGMWAAQRRLVNNDPVYHQMLDENTVVHQRAMENFQALGLIGRVVKVRDAIAAYTFGYALNPDMFCVLLEIADTAFKGLPTFIFREFCADDDLRSYRFINVMDDFELKNIAQTKMSFRPAFLLPSYVMTQKEESIIPVKIGG